MGNRSEQPVLAAVLGVGALFILGSAIAAPPPSSLVQPRARSQIQTLGQHLDLRAPSPAADVGEKTGSLPAMSRRHSSGSPEQAQLPPLGSDGMRSRLGFQDFVRRTQHEGLPLARLFESKSALVHLGLSPKGKPGLWLVQKIR
jgi:hypothetical protein